MRFFDHSQRELEHSSVPDRRALLTLVLVCSGWGTIPFVARQVDLPAAGIVFARVWIGAAGLGLLLLVRPDRTSGRTGPPTARLLSVRPVACLAAGTILAVHWTAMFAAYQRAPAATVIFIVFLAPVGIAAIAPRALGERVGPRTVAALAIAVVGFTLVAGPTRRALGVDGLALSILTATTFVAFVVLSKPLAEAYGGLRLTFMELVVAGVVLIPVAARLEWGRPRAAWLWLVLLGLAHTAVGTALYMGALARVPATHAGILGYLEPLGVVVFGWFFAGEPTAWTTVAGGLLIVVAGIVVISSSRVAASPEVGAGVPG